MDGILERIRALEPDLLVMTTHGRGGISRAFLGSVTEEMIRRASVPVLLVRPHGAAAQAPSEITLRRILIPLDGSALAEKAMGPAQDVAQARGAADSLFHMVWGPAGVKIPDGALSDARTYLGHVAQRLAGLVPSVQTSLGIGADPATAILEEVAAQGCDLIALATRGRGGLKRQCC